MNREAHAAYCSKLWAVHVRLFAVNRRHVRHCHKLFDRTRALTEQRFEALSQRLNLTAQTQTINYLMVAFYISAL